MVWTKLNGEGECTRKDGWKRWRNDDGADEIAFRRVVRLSGARVLEGKGKEVESNTHLAYVYEHLEPRTP